MKADDENRLEETPKRKAEWLKPYHFKPGNNANPSGRPKMPPELKKALKPALKFVTNLVEDEGADVNQRRLQVADVLAYHLGKPGAELLDDSEELPDDRAKLFCKVADKWAEEFPAAAEALKRAKELTNATPNAVPALDGMRNGPDGDAGK